MKHDIYQSILCFRSETKETTARQQHAQPSVSAIGQQTAHLSQVNITDQEKTLLDKLSHELSTQMPFKAGGISRHLKQWSNLTTDNRILLEALHLTLLKDHINLAYQNS